MRNSTSESRTARDPSSELPRSADLASDPVCGMDLDPSEARFRVERLGQTIYFCSQSCMTKFDRDPEKYSGHASRR